MPTGHLRGHSQALCQRHPGTRSASRVQPLSTTLEVKLGPESPPQNPPILSPVDSHPGDKPCLLQKTGVGRAGEHHSQRKPRERV